MTENLENIILEHLRTIRQELKFLKDGQTDLKSEILSLKQYLHSIQGEAFRREQTIAGIQVDIDRIKTRLELSDS